MKFVVGIGNPGPAYEKTRHNVGFQVVDWIQAHSTFASKAVKWSGDKSLKSSVAKLDESNFLVKPQLFVNNTGSTIALIQGQNPDMRPHDYLFVCDDVNLQFGKLRLRASGSAGGHHGLESVIAERGSEDFPRLRVGVANESMPKDLTGFVLEKFSSEEEKQIEKILEKAASVCETWIRDGFDAAMVRLSQLQSK